MHCKVRCPPSDPNTKYVIDGGFMLHSIVNWKQKKSFDQIATVATLTLVHKYPKCTVVFGYPEAQTKDPTHTHRLEKIGPCSEVGVTLKSLLTVSKDKFLGKKKSKQQFIWLLSKKLEESRVPVHHAHDDADFLVASTAIIESQRNTVVLVANDTDVILLLCHYFCDELSDIYVNITEEVWNI